MTRIIANVLVALCCAAVAGAGNRAVTVSSQASGDRGTWRNLTNGNSVSYVQVDPRTGEVWSAGSGGAVRWDPVTETYAKFTAVDGLATNVVTALAIDADGTKWFGSEGGGVSRLKADGTWSVFTPTVWGSSVGADLITDIAFDSRGNSWFANYFGSVIRLSKDGDWREIDLDPNGFEVSDVDGVAVDREDNVWLASEAGAVRLAQDGTITRFDRRDGLFPDDAWSVEVDRQGAVWVGTSGSASRREPNGRWTNHQVQGGVRGMAFGQNGQAWFDTGAGLAYLKADGSFFYHFWLLTGSVTIDADGAVWATPGDGLVKLTGRPDEPELTWFKTPDQLPHLDAVSIAIDSHGNKWMGGWSGGITRLGPDGVAERFGDLPEVDGVREIESIAEDTLGNLWFASARNGVIRRSQDGTWSHITEADGLPSDSVGEIAPDLDGSVWIESGDGVSRRFPDGSWRTYTQADGLLDDDIRSVAVDRLGNRWFGGRGGVTRLSANGAWSTLTSPWAQAGQFLRIEDIFFDSHGNTWFISADATLEMPVPHFTLTRYAADGSWRSLGLSDQFDALYGFNGASDPAGNVWLVPSWKDGGPVLRLGPDGTWTRFGATDGVGSIQPSAVAVDPRSGDVWIALSDGGGISAYTPNPVGASCKSPTALTTGADVTAQLDAADTTHVYAISVPAPFTRVEIAIPDTDNTVAVDVFRDCDTTAGPATGRHIGPSTGRHIGGEQRLVFDVALQTGTYFVAVSTKTDQVRFPLRYRLRIGLTPVDPNAKHTLILTHEPLVQTLFGLNGDDPELLAWRQGMQDLAELPSVGGLLVRNVQADTNDAVQAAYSRWILRPNDAARANAVAEALRDWIWALRRELPRIKYIVLAGDDRVIPHLRASILERRGQTDWRTETSYAAEGTIDVDSGVGTALQLDFTLTDDVYGARQPVVWGDGQELYVPELAVGRLVERPRQMSAVIGAFMASQGTLKLQRGLVAASNHPNDAFMMDAAGRVDDELSRAGLDRSARTPELVGTAWSTDLLRQRLFGSRRDLAFLATHATHAQYLMPDNDAIQSQEIVAAGGSLTGVLAFGLACHGGLNVPGPDHRQPLDFPEAWLGRGGTLVGTTGWAYGMDHGLLGYQESLVVDFARLLLAGGGSAVGDALVTAKQRYFQEHDLNAKHVKTLASTVLYGLPMYRVEPPQAPAAVSSTADATGTEPRVMVSDPPPASDGPDTPTQTGSQMQVFRDRTYTLPTDRLALVTTTVGNYYTFSGLRPRVESGEPIQPKIRFTLGEVTFDERVIFEPRGVVLTRAEYHDVPNFQPLIEWAQVFGGHPASLDQAPRFDEPGWYPRVPVTLRRIDRTRGAGTLLVGQVWANLLISAGQFNAATKTERLFDRIVLDEYYSAAPDRNGPVVQAVDTAASGTVTQLRVRASDEGGLARVLVAYSVMDRPWQSLELRHDGGGGAWNGEIPTAASYIVQVVDNAGNVTTVDDRGDVNRPCTAFCVREPTRVFMPSAQKTLEAMP